MIPETIKQTYKISIIFTVIGVILGIIFRKPELYFAFFVGSIISMINIYLLILGVYKLVNFEMKSKVSGFLEYLKRFCIYIIGLIIVVYISRIFFKNSIKSNIVFTGIGFLNFKISLFLNEIKKSLQK